MLTVAQLIAAGIGPTQAKAFAVPLAAACAKFQIDTPARIAGLVGQCMVESGLFVHLEEGLYYSDPARTANIFRSAFHGLASEAAAYCKNPQKLANKVYGPRADLGNRGEASGDGWKYRGRGLIQVTGLTNYTNCALATEIDFAAQPDLMAQPDGAAMSAAWFIAKARVNQYADAGNWDAITKAVNPAMLDAGLRRQYSQQALAALIH
jgi:putative chitinase